VVRKGYSGAIVLLAVLLFSGCGNSIHDLVRWDEREQVEALIQRSPDAVHELDALEKTPLFFAATFNRPEMARLLVANGADIEAGDRTGYRALHVAASLNHTAVIEVLLELGADIEARDKFGDTPLHVAGYWNRQNAIRLLVEKGADLTARNERGLTPAEMARDSVQEAAAALLEELAGAGDSTAGAA